MTDYLTPRELWLRERRLLLQKEKAFTKAKDELAAARRALPRYAVNTHYAFQTEKGPQGLADLFGHRGQLIVYHFMFGPDWEQGCKSCSFWADGFDGAIPHLNQRDVAMVCASTAPLAKLLAFRKRMGWRFDWVSSGGSSFNADFGVTGKNGEALLYNFDRQIEDAGELPGLSVFQREGNVVFHTYSCYARGLDIFNPAYQLLDMVPKGRDESALPFSMGWVKHHDNYQQQEGTQNG
jgi:predicted dithiol-disulfide oxidoreductase (DUF899 family)